MGTSFSQSTMTVIDYDAVRASAIAIENKTVIDFERLSV
jgi:hypothetical protein